MDDLQLQNDCFLKVNSHQRSSSDYYRPLSFFSFEKCVRGRIRRTFSLTWIRGTFVQAGTTTCPPKKLKNCAQVTCKKQRGLILQRESTGRTTIPILLFVQMRWLQSESESCTSGRASLGIFTHSAVPTSPPWGSPGTATRAVALRPRIQRLCHSESVC